MAMAFAAHGVVTSFPKQRQLNSSAVGTVRLSGRPLTGHSNKRQGLAIVRASTDTGPEQGAQHTQHASWAPSRAALLRAALVATGVGAVTGDAAQAAPNAIQQDRLDGLKGNLNARDRSAKLRDTSQSSVPDIFVRPDIRKQNNLNQEARQLIKEAQKEFKDKEAACALFDKAVDVAPNYAPVWSNRAVFFYNQREFTKATQDIKVAYALETATVGKKNVDPFILNAYGDISLATAEFTDALKYYGDASKKTLNPALFREASIGYIFTLFEMGFEPEASRNTRKLLKKAPDLFDMQAFLVASEWCVGREEAAIGEWDRFQKESPYGVSYNNLLTVDGRWPPKAVAALNAFQNKERKGAAANFGDARSYSFDCNDPATKPHWRRAACRGAPPPAQTA